jgi:ACR3 family arsenite efflux pump ArsB
MAYVLSNGLLCMILMTMVSCDGWSHLTLLTLFDLDALLTWFLEDVFMMIPRMLSIIWRTLHTLCKALHLLMIVHTLGHLPTPPGPWMLDR